jgi:hypothetical protein
MHPLYVCRTARLDARHRHTYIPVLNNACPRLTSSFSSSVRPAVDTAATDAAVLFSFPDGELPIYPHKIINCWRWNGIVSRKKVYCYDMR